MTKEDMRKAVASAVHVELEVIRWRYTYGPTTSAGWLSKEAAVQDRASIVLAVGQFLNVTEVEEYLTPNPSYPDYPNDIAAIYGVLSALPRPDESRQDYSKRVHNISLYATLMCMHLDRRIFQLGPEHWCEVYLRAVGQWRDAEKELVVA